MENKLNPRLAGTGHVQAMTDRWRMEIPAGSSRSYRLAQYDDYSHLTRNHFTHIPAWKMRLEARVSANDLPGTWGFGLWNDPFGLSLGFGGRPGRLPALPQVAWFMQASPPNWLSLQGDSAGIPANGFFAGTFRSPALPAPLLAPALLAVPFCAIRPLSRLFRQAAGRFIRQAGARLTLDATQWHTYSIYWLHEECRFYVDESQVLQTTCSPLAPLGLVIWIDNQFAAWTPEGQLRYGILENPSAWLEIKNLTVQEA